MSKNFHEMDKIKRHIRMADLKLSIGELKECKAELTAANKLITAVEKGNGKHDQKSELGGEG